MFCIVQFVEENESVNYIVNDWRIGREWYWWPNVRPNEVDKL